MHSSDSITIYYAEYERLARHVLSQPDTYKKINVSFLYGPSVQLHFKSPQNIDLVRHELTDFIRKNPASNSYIRNTALFRLFKNNSIRNGFIDNGVSIYVSEKGHQQHVTDYLSLLDRIVNELILEEDDSFLIALKLCLIVMAVTHADHATIVRSFEQSLYLTQFYSPSIPETGIAALYEQKKLAFSGLLESNLELIEYAAYIYQTVQEGELLDDPCLDQFSVTAKILLQSLDADEVQDYLLLVCGRLNVCDDQMSYLLYILQKVLI